MAINLMDDSDFRSGENSKIKVSEVRSACRWTRRGVEEHQKQTDPVHETRLYSTPRRKHRNKSNRIKKSARMSLKRNFTRSIGDHVVGIRVVEWVH